MLSVTEKKFNDSSWYVATEDDVLRTRMSADWDMSGDYTIDLWLRVVTAPTGAAQPLCIDGQAATHNGHYLSINASRQIAYTTAYAASPKVARGGAYSTFTLALNTWYHIAVSRSGNTVRLFCDGALLTTFTIAEATSTFNINRNITIGSYYDSSGLFNGYIDEFRFTKGVARYTAAFKAPTYSRKVLALEFEGSTFTDTSSAPKALTTYAGPALSTAIPAKFGGKTMYVAGNAALATPALSELVIGTEDFLVESWIYPTSQETDNIFFDTRNTGNGAGGLTLTLHGGLIYWADGSSSMAGLAHTMNAWNHAAYVRENGVGYLYVNDQLASSQVDSRNYSNNQMIIGAASYYPVGAAGFVGYMDRTQVFVGAGGQYSSLPVFAPSESLDTFEVKRVTTIDGSVDTFDLDRKWIAFGNTAIGNGAVTFDGTSACRLETLGSNDFLFSADDFCIEAFVKVTTLSTTTATIIGRWGTSTESWKLYIDANRRVNFVWVTAGGTQAITTNATQLTLGTEYHVAVYRSNGISYLAINGVPQSISIGDIRYIDGPVVVGNDENLGSYFVGTIRGLRISKVTSGGYAAANFMVPILPYASSSFFDLFNGLDESSYSNETALWEQRIKALNGSVTPSDMILADALSRAISSQSYSGKIVYLLPFIGDNITAHRVPLRDTLNVGAADLVGTAVLTSTNAKTATGLSNLSEQAGALDTRIKPSQLGQSNSGGIGWYELQYTAGTGVEPIGTYSNTNSPDERYCLDLRSSLQKFRWGGVNNAAGPATAAGSGHYYGQRRSASSRNLYKDGVAIGAEDTVNDPAARAGETSITVMGCRNANAGGNYQAYWKGRGACAYLTDGTMTGSEIANFHTLLQQYIVIATGR